MNPVTRPNNSRRRGFTLVELLVVIAMIALLTVMAFIGIKMFIKKAEAAKDMSTMRQISACITMYAGDHNDYMPGPLFTGQTPVFNKPISTNIKEWRRLADCLAPYMGYDNPKEGDFIEPMASSWQRKPETRDVPAYFMQQKLPMADGFSFENPWGKPAPAPTNERVPMKMSTVLLQPKAARTWAMTDVDQLHPEVTSQDWKPKAPAGMSHGSYRLALYFDGSVGKLDVNNNPM